MGKGNVLEPGQPRLCWLTGGNPGAPPTAVMLQDTGSQIDLTMLIGGISAAAEGDPYSRWWSSGMIFDDDPKRTKFSYHPPRVLRVHDVQGPVVLVGCRTGASTRNLHSGEGHIVANYAVLGARHLDYEAVHGIRTEVPALSAWTGLTSIDYQASMDEHGRLSALQLTLETPQEILLAADLNLKLRLSWRVDSQDDGVAIHQGAVLETLVDEPIEWNEHLRVHRLIVGLASLSAWKRFGISSVWSLRQDDGAEDLAGESQPQWHAVITHDLPAHENVTNSTPFLYPFSETGPEVVQRWLRLHSEYGDAIDPLLNILWSDYRWGHAEVVQSGIALENLAYQIVVRKKRGQGLNSRRQLNFQPGLRAILDDMAVKPFDEVDEWIQDAHSVYMSAKHPDRPSVDALTQINTLRKNLLIVRFWVGLELGIPAEFLRLAFPRDPLHGARVMIE